MPHRNVPLNKLFSSTNHALQTLTEIISASEGVVAIAGSDETVIKQTAQAMEEHLRLHFHMLGYPVEMSIHVEELVENSHGVHMLMLLDISVLLASQRGDEDSYWVAIGKGMNWRIQLRQPSDPVPVMRYGKFSVPLGTMAQDLVPDLVMLSKGHFNKHIIGRSHAEVAMGLYHFHYGLARTDTFEWNKVSDFINVVLRDYAEANIPVKREDHMKLLDMARQDKFEEMVNHLAAIPSTIPVARVDDTPLFWTPDPDVIKFLDERYAKREEE